MIFSMLAASIKGEVILFSTASTTPSLVWMPIAVDPSLEKNRKDFVSFYVIIYPNKLNPAGFFFKHFRLQHDNWSKYIPFHQPITHATIWNVFWNRPLFKIKQFVAWWMVVILKWFMVSHFFFILTRQSSWR